MIAEFQTQHRKLLVVDDEPLVRQTLSYCLEDEYEVTAVASGEEAIEASMRESFPVVILDLCMDGLSGIETLKRLKQIQDTQNVIILTAYESMESAISALNCGAFNYLTKPFERAHLKEVISHGFEDYEQQNLRKQEMQNRLMGVHDSFFSLLCHEFNTPLNIIHGYSELLSDNLKNPEHKAWAEDIRKSSDDLHNILMEIVDYIGASHQAAAGIEKDFTPAVLLEPLASQLREDSVRLQIIGDASVRRQFRGPAGSIFMIARKLLRMASHQSKHVRINVGHVEEDEAGGRIRLAVSGTGIRKDVVRGDEIEQLFEPYHAVPHVSTDTRGNLGLELATCKKIAAYAKGAIECVFNSEGELEFVAEIPVKSLGSANR